VELLLRARAGDKIEWPFRAVVLVLQKEEHRHPHQADEDSAKHHRSVSNERVQNFFLNPSSGRRHNSLKAIIVNNFK
jgi:hypothetical protein